MLPYFCRSISPAEKESHMVEWWVYLWCLYFSVFVEFFFLAYRRDPGRKGIIIYCLWKGKDHLMATRITIIFIVIFIKNSATEGSANPTVKYQWVAHVMGTRLTITKGPTLATGAAECLHCRLVCNRARGLEKQHEAKTMLRIQHNAKTQRNTKEQCPQV